MEWSDAGLVLGLFKHGENAAIADVLTPCHGRYRGLVRGAAGKRLRGVLQPGNAVCAHWRARLAEHLGAFTLELETAHAAALMDAQEKLAALSALCALTSFALPERAPHRAVYDGLGAAIAAIRSRETLVWQAVMVRFELGLLDELGFALDLSKCTVTGERDDLAYVSPRSARAVSRGGAGGYAARLLALPAFLLGSQAGAPARGDIADGFRLTGFFLERHLGPLPAARGRFLDRIGG